MRCLQTNVGRLQTILGNVKGLVLTLLRHYGQVRGRTAKWMQAFTKFDCMESGELLPIAKFHKQEDELETLYDKWLYVLKNLYRLENRPKVLRDKVFDRLFKEAEIAAFSPEELREYEDSLKAYRDIKNSIDTARREGHAEGRAEGLAEGEKNKSVAIARKMKAKGFSASEISEMIGLTEAEIEAL